MAPKHAKKRAPKRSRKQGAAPAATPTPAAALTPAEIDKLAANPQAVKRMYIACGCNNTGCVGGHTSAALNGVTSKVCPECGDVGETHYLMVSVASDSWPTFIGARRGHDDDDPEAKKKGLVCEGSFGKALWESEEQFAARGGKR